MKVKINKDTCIGCGACQAICPFVFEYDDEGIMDVKTSEINDEIKDDVIDAMEGCPVEAIIVKEDEK